MQRTDSLHAQSSFEGLYDKEQYEETSAFDFPAFRFYGLDGQPSLAAHTPERCLPCPSLRLPRRVHAFVRECATEGADKKYATCCRLHCVAALQQEAAK